MRQWEKFLMPMTTDWLSEIRPCLVPQEWTLSRHFSDLSFLKTVQILNYLNYDGLQVHLCVNWFRFFFCVCFLFFSAELLIQIMTLLGQTNTSRGCPASHFDCLACLHCKHCTRKERPKGKVTCSKSGYQALDWESPSTEIQYHVLLLNCSFPVCCLFWCFALMPRVLLFFRGYRCS